MHTDNGADFTAAALHRGCDEHGIGLILRPIATPHYGGHIERLIGTLMGRVQFATRNHRFEHAGQGRLSVRVQCAADDGGAGAVADLGDLRAIPSPRA